VRDSLGITAILYAVAVAAVCSGCAVLGRCRPRSVGVALVTLELVAVVLAALDAADVLRGGHGPGLSTHVGYLVTSLVVIPATAATVKTDHGRWASAAVAVGCLVQAVVSLRLHQTLGSPDRA
jgi:hypothetical protein